MGPELAQLIFFISIILSGAIRVVQGGFKVYVGLV